MAVQWVNRPNLDFRGFSGLISSRRKPPLSKNGSNAPIVRAVRLFSGRDQADRHRSIDYTPVESGHKLPAALEEVHVTRPKSPQILREMAEVNESNVSPIG
jgi:hypothetical protein